MSDEIVGASATPESFEEKLNRKLASRAEKPAGLLSELDTEKAFNPADDAPKLDFTPDPNQIALDNAIKSLDIVDAYNRWTSKKKCPPTSRRESIKVSCPNPSHPDRDPSCWLNRDKNVYYCSKCGGGDVFDLAAYHFGYPVPGYKNDSETFKNLRDAIGLSLGFTFVQVGSTYSPMPPSVKTSSATKDKPSSLAKAAPVLKADPSGDVSKELLISESSTLSDISSISDEIPFSTFPENFEWPSIDWRSIIPENTFLSSWLHSTTVDDCPEEFHFWTGLQLVGFAVGRNVLLADSPPVVANLFTVLTGPSGTGKSRAKRHLRETLGEVLPYDESNPLSTGTRIIGKAGSGEYLIKNFSRPIPDPADPKAIMGHAPVRGYIDYEEFSGLVAAGNRTGSTLQDSLMEIYDAQKFLAGGSETHGKRVAQDPFGQAISTTQNASLGRLLSKQNDTSGFINRWVFAGGKPKPVRSWGAINVDLTEPKRKLRDLYQWGSSFKLIQMSDPAMHLWDEFFHASIHPSKLTNEQAGSAMLGRLDLTLKKIILLLTINLKLTTVTVDIVKAAIELFPYLTKTYETVAVELARTDETEHGNAMLEAIRELTKTNGRPPTGRDIYRANQKKFGSYAQCAKMLEDLMKINLIIKEKHLPAGPGRPSERYALND